MEVVRGVFLQDSIKLYRCIDAEERTLDIVARSWGFELYVDVVPSKSKAPYEETPEYCTGGPFCPAAIPSRFRLVPSEVKRLHTMHGATLSCNCT